ncbi:hypothetical protein IMSHALPRED_009321 [Imshaugia aleurites]|uniref:Uncharacterized protein n=1 Tax=Imshaugia aleurites TaxID=172621 RepID=A0A8H3G2G1_9LECA|nr:hypothetical protein IMSHALPRED_009321 [Imshaugia aleurites]
MITSAVSSSEASAVPSNSNALSSSDVSTTQTRRHRIKKPSTITAPVQISTMDVITTEVVYTTITSCPVTTKTHTKNGQTSIEIITSVSTFLTTDTVTVCDKCTATTPSFTPAASTPAAAATTATNIAVNTPSRSGSNAAASMAISSPAPTTMVTSKASTAAPLPTTH